MQFRVSLTQGFFFSRSILVLVGLYQITWGPHFPISGQSTPGCVLGFFLHFVERVNAFLVRDDLSGYQSVSGSVQVGQITSSRHY